MVRQASLRFGLWLAMGLAAGCAPPGDKSGEDPSSTPSNVVDESQADAGAAGPPSSSPAVTDLAAYASECFAEQARRNPAGRVLILSANAADICSAVAEIGADHGRWHFDWRRAEQGWVHEGEVAWPRDWPASEAAGIPAAEFSAARIADRLDAARARHADAPQEDWLYEVLWLPAPFERALVFVTLHDRSEGAGPYDSFVRIYDGGRELEGEEYEQAQQRYALTRFELREDHNYKGAIFESLALMESAGMLEVDARALELSPVERRLEECLPALREVNRGSRILRIGIEATSCRVLLASARDREDFYLLSLSAEGYEELPSQAVEAELVAANLLLDRGRLSAARARQVLAAATAQLGQPVERLAIAVADGQTVWQASVGTGSAARLAWFDDAGRARDAPGRFPLTRIEAEAGFAPTEPLIGSVVEGP